MKVSNELLVKLSMHHPAASNNGLIYRTCFRTHLIDCKQRLTGSGISNPVLTKPPPNLMKVSYLYNVKSCWGCRNVISGVF